MTQLGETLPAVSTLCTLAVRVVLLDELVVVRWGERGGGEESMVMGWVEGDSGTSLAVGVDPAAAGDVDAFDSAVVSAVAAATLAVATSNDFVVVCCSCDCGWIISTSSPVTSPSLDVTFCGCDCCGRCDRSGDVLIFATS